MGRESPPAALEVRDLSKAYKTGHIRRTSRPALQNLTFTASQGEIFGYLGPNGAGKTTTLKILMGLLLPDSGSATVLGIPLEERSWRYRAGYLPEQPYLYDYLTASEYLDYVGRLFGLSKEARRDSARRLLELVGLARWADVALRKFSKGMVQRAGIAQALINDPEIVFLDEPMSGLDPLGRHLVRNIMLDLKKAGKTVLFSTHILSDAEAVCDRVAVLRSGRLLQVGRLDEILNVDVSHYEVLLSGLSHATVASLPADVRAQPVGERWRLAVPEESLRQVLDLVRSEACRLLAVQPVRQSLEEYFLKEVGKGVWAEAD